MTLKQLVIINKNIRIINEKLNIKIKHPGAFTKWCVSSGFKKSSFACIKKALIVADRTNNNLLKKRAVLARTFKKWAKNRRNMNG